MNPLASIGRVHEVVQIVSLDARQDIANQPSRFGPHHVGGMPQSSCRLRFDVGVKPVVDRL